MALARLAAGLALLGTASSHATFQALWVDSADVGSECARLPLSNTPVTNVAGNDIRCNANSGPVSGKCLVKAGGAVTIEIHQQPSGRTCGAEAIGGAHYGPVMVYLSKVADSATADGSAGWFKIFENGWVSAGKGAGDNDLWGVKDLNTCCGKMNVPIPADIADGDYLLRAEALALHTAGSSGGAQFYMTCFQLSISGGKGTATPATVNFPGAYKASDPGILVDIHSALSKYVVPGPPVIASGTTRKPGGACTGCESTCKVGAGPKGSVSLAPAAPAPTGGAGGGPAGCSVAKYGQCGGNGYSGCTTCASGSKCTGGSPPYYMQCV